MSESAAGGEPSPGLRSVLESQAGGGNPLPDTVRETLEPRFDADLSDVRVHADGEAHRMATGLGARAFTYGSDIYFRAGAYDPAGHEGRKTLAHEVAHTVQQSEPRVQREGEGDEAQAAAGELPSSDRPSPDPHPATRAAEPGTPRRPTRRRRDLPEPSLWESAIGALRRRDAAFADAIVRLDTDFGSLIPSVFGTMAMPGAMPVRLEHQSELDASVDRADDARTSMARGAFDHVSSLVWFRQLERTLGRMSTVLDAVDRTPNGRWFTELPRQRHARVAALRSTTQGQFADRLAFDVEADLIREVEEARPRPDPVEQAVDYMRGFASHPFGATATTRAFFVARHLVVELGLSNAEVRTALRRLRERSPEAYQTILMGGRLVIELLMNHDYFGFDEFVAEGEDLGSGWMRAELESLRADRPVDRRFDAGDMLVAGLAFIAGAFQGVGDAIIGVLVGIAELFNPATWAALVQIPALIEEYLSTPEGRYRVGQMLGEATASEERELREAEPFEFGRRLGQYFGRIVAEIVLAVIGIGWIGHAARGFRFTGRIAEVMSGFAEVVVNSRGVRAALTGGRFVSGVVRGVLRAIRRRLIQLAAELPEWAHIFPTWRLEAAAMRGSEEAGILARALEEAPVAALTEAETVVARAGRRVGEAERSVATALRRGDEAAVQSAAARLDEAMGELERATARLPSRAGAATAGVGVEGARAVESATDDIVTRLDDLEVRDGSPASSRRTEEPPVEVAPGSAAEPELRAREAETAIPAEESPELEARSRRPGEEGHAPRPNEAHTAPEPEAEIDAAPVGEPDTASPTSADAREPPTRDAAASGAPVAEPPRVDPGGRGNYHLDDARIDALPPERAARLRELQGRIPRSEADLQELTRLRAEANGLPRGRRLPPEPGTPEHMLERWREYDGDWDFDRWAAGHPSRMRNSVRGLAIEAEYRAALADADISARSGIVTSDGHTRQVDILIEGAEGEGRHLIQIKAGDESLTTVARRSGGASAGSSSWSNADALAIDRQLVRSGETVTWVFEGHASGPLVRRALESEVRVVLRVDSPESIARTRRLLERAGMSERAIQRAIEEGRLAFVEGSRAEVIAHVVRMAGG